MSNNTNTKPLDLDAFAGHTPGPFNIKHPHKYGAKSYRLVRREDFGLVGRFVRLEDAQLAAAAPALLAECQRQRAVLERIAAETCDHGPMPFCPREAARAALDETKEAAQ